MPKTKRKKYKPSLLKVLSYIPGIVAQKTASATTYPVRKFGSLIKRQINKEINFRQYHSERGRKQAENLRKFWRGR